MLRRNLQQEITCLEQGLLRLGTLVEAAIANSVRALTQLDRTLATQVIEGDTVIDQRDLELEQHCLKLFALQQPLARDLRTIVTILKIATDLERIADHATNIAEITLRIEGDSLIKPLEDIPRMADMARQMLHDALTAFIQRDVALAREVAERDEEIDVLYAVLYDELLGFVMSGSSPQMISQAIHLIFVARFLERTADHATNIAERAIYMVTGERIKLNGF